MTSALPGIALPGMILVGIDPGPTTSGYAILHLEGALSPGRAPRLSYGAKGEFDSDDTASLRRAIVEVPSMAYGTAANVVVIERLEGYTYPGRSFVASRAIAETVRMGERIRGRAIALLSDAHARQAAANAVVFGRDVRRVPVVADVVARAARATVCGKGSAKDRTVKTCVERFIAGWPKRSNVHERDAALVAMAWAWTGGKAATLSNEEKTGT